LTPVERQQRQIATCEQLVASSRTSLRNAEDMLRMTETTLARARAVPLEKYPEAKRVTMVAVEKGGA
jgi:hypothetical protein